jgi:hypothetical protein
VSKPTLVENKIKNIKSQMGRSRRCWLLHHRFYATSLITSISPNQLSFVNISASYTSFMVLDNKYMAREALAEGFVFNMH